METPLLRILPLNPFGAVKVIPNSPSLSILKPVEASTRSSCSMFNSRSSLGFTTKTLLPSLPQISSTSSKGCDGWGEVPPHAGHFPALLRLILWKVMDSKSQKRRMFARLGLLPSKILKASETCMLAMMFTMEGVHPHHGAGWKGCVF